MIDRRGFLNCDASHGSFAILIVLVLVRNVLTAEEDARLLTPIAGFAKSIVKTITLGMPLELESTSTTDVAKSFLSFVWRTGFPVSMPSRFLKKAQDFYNRIRDRVYETDVENMDRLSLANLKVSLDTIVDSIVEEVRQSPDGLYTDYTKVMVGNRTLEEACYQAGLQIKAYKIDITNYRNIAGVVLGVPLMPQVASTVIGAASFVPTLDSVGNATGQLMQSPVGKIPGSAVNSIVSKLQLSGQNRFIPQIVSSPLSLFNSNRTPAAASSPDRIQMTQSMFDQQQQQLAEQTLSLQEVAA